MGSNTISTISDGTTGTASQVNQYKTALAGNIVPRNTSGAATDIFGTMGESGYKWLKAFIASGYWTLGDIKPHHTYNGAAPIDQGWYPCDGTIINETNYNTVHGAGSWDIYIISSGLDGKYAPNLVNKYLVGKTSTTQDGTSGITSVGNSSNQVDLEHTHTISDHNHQWYQYNSGTFDESYNSSGTEVSMPVGTADSGGHIKKSFDTSGNSIGDLYTSNTSITPGNSLSTAQSIQPESIEVIYYIRII